MSQQPPRQPVLFSSATVYYKDGTSQIYEAVLHHLQLNPGAPPVLILEQPRGERHLYYINMGEVTRVAMVPSKLELV